MRHALEWLRWNIMMPPSVSKDAEQPELSHTAGGGAKWHSHSGGHFHSWTYTEHMTQQCHSQVPHPKERKHVCTESYTSMFTATLLNNHPNWKQPRRSSAGIDEQAMGDPYNRQLTNSKHRLLMISPTA